MQRSAIILAIPCTKDGAMEIAKRSRGTPRIANRLLKRVRDYAEVLGDGKITQELADIALGREDIDKLGLDRLDRRLLEMIIKGYNGGPVGLETLASALGEESVTLEEVANRSSCSSGSLQELRAAAPLLRSLTDTWGYSRTVSSGLISDNRAYSN